jgi:hypothetical protein
VCRVDGDVVWVPVDAVGREDRHGRGDPHSDRVSDNPLDVGHARGQVAVREVEDLDGMDAKFTGRRAQLHLPYAG